MLNRDLSDAINRLRMPLAFLVVCVHADFTKKFSYAGKQVNCAYDIGYHIVNFISHTLADIAVPLFYLISGMLCFYSIRRGMDIAVFSKKSLQHYYCHILFGI